MQRKTKSLLDEVIDKLTSNDPGFIELILRHDTWNKHNWIIKSDSDVSKLALALTTNTTLRSIQISGEISAMRFDRDFVWHPALAKTIGESIKDHPSLNVIRLDMDAPGWYN